MLLLIMHKLLHLKSLENFTKMSINVMDCTELHLVLQYALCHLLFKTPQNAPNCTIFVKLSWGGAFPQTPTS